MLIPSLAHAASFDTVEDAVGKMWFYTFSVKSGPLEKSTPLSVPEKNCAYYYNARDFKKSPSEMAASAAKGECFFDEASARKDAQEKADAYEADFKKKGFSSSDIETKRQAIVKGAAP
jgi:hypothetical protein